MKMNVTDDNLLYLLEQPETYGPIKCELAPNVNPLRLTVSRFTLIRTMVCDLKIRSRPHYKDTQNICCDTKGRNAKPRVQLHCFARLRLTLRLSMCGPLRL